MLFLFWLFVVLGIFILFFFARSFLVFLFDCAEEILWLSGISLPEWLVDEVEFILDPPIEDWLLDVYFWWVKRRGRRRVRGAKAP